MQLSPKNPEKENKKTSTEQEISQLNKTGDQKPQETIIIGRKNKRNRENNEKYTGWKNKLKRKRNRKNRKNNYST